MQVMFFRQHFGEFALGMASVDDAIKTHQGSIDHDKMSEKFFTIDRGGLSMHPWADDRAYEDRIAIVGSGLIDNLDATPRLYAQFRCVAHNLDFYLSHNLIGQRYKSLPSPERLAEDIMWNGRVTDIEPERDWWQWGQIERNRIPMKYRRLLDKTMARVVDSLGQGADFFEKTKSR